MEVSLQLYSIHEETEKDFKASLEKAAQIGYQGVEFAGYGGLTAEELKKLLEDNGLYSVGTHCGTQVFEESFKAELEFNKAIGSKYIICPWAKMDTREEILSLADLLNQAGELASKENIKVGYHNHDQEFTRIDGKYALDLLAENTTNDVILELDVFWAAYAGVDPLDYIKKWGRKIELIHMKQMNAEKANVDAGEGILDMKKIKDTAVYTRYFIVEHEEFDKPVWDAIQNDYDFLNEIQ